MQMVHIKTQKLNWTNVSIHLHAWFRGCRTHRLILQVELSNQLAVVGGVHHLPADEQLDLGVRGVGLYPVEDAAPHRANCVVGVGPDVQVVHLPALVGETHDQRDVLPSEGPAGWGRRQQWCQVRRGGWWRVVLWLREVYTAQSKAHRQIMQAVCFTHRPPQLKHCNLNTAMRSRLHHWKQRWQNSNIHLY